MEVQTVPNTAKSLDEHHLKSWIGRERIIDDTLCPTVYARACALFGRAPQHSTVQVLPPLWHWFYLQPDSPQTDLGLDGHPETGGFLPPVALPRRMWGASQLRFSKPLVVGHAARCRSEILAVDLKTGGSGTLCIVRVGHEITQEGETCLSEEQTIVYREAPAAPQSTAQALDCPVGSMRQAVLRPDAITLFRFSALTWNAHRIHYDRPYATLEEGYPGLVVHGPYTALSLAGFACDGRPGDTLRGFSFRAVSPLFEGDAVQLHARSTDRGEELWAARPDGGLAMSASARF